MRAFIWTMFILYDLLIILRLLMIGVALSENNGKEFAMNTISLVICSGFAVWAGCLLFG